MTYMILVIGQSIFLNVIITWPIAVNVNMFLKHFKVCTELVRSFVTFLFLVFYLAYVMSVSVTRKVPEEKLFVFFFIEKTDR